MDTPRREKALADLKILLDKAGKAGSKIDLKERRALKRVGTRLVRHGFESLMDGRLSRAEAKVMAQLSLEFTYLLLDALED